MTPGSHLPTAFLERLGRQFDDERFERIVDGMSSARVTGFRVNRLVAGEEDPMAELKTDGIELHPSVFAAGAAWVFPESRQKLLFSRAYVEKRIYVQNLASMLPVLVLEPQTGDRILDLAAAPGSKTLQLADIGGPTSEIAAVELSRTRFFRMKSLLADYGADFVRTFLRDGSTVWRARPEYFDRVLLDAPCASEGRFLVDDPETYRYWMPRKTKEMVRKQKRLLFSAIQSLKPDGVLVYSTCSLSAEENEGVVSSMLKRFGAALRTEEITLAVSEIAAPMVEWRNRAFHKGVELARRIVPSEQMEGFFICKIRKLDHTLG